jgi:predicted CopG family antitoxin
MWSAILSSWLELLKTSSSLKPKNISITLEAYKRLVALKRERESFSDVINREMSNKKIKLNDFHGILSKKAGEELEKNLLETRKLHRKLHKKRIERQMKEFG